MWFNALYAATEVVVVEEISNVEQVEAAATNASQVEKSETKKKENMAGEV